MVRTAKLLLSVAVVLVGFVLLGCEESPMASGGGNMALAFDKSVVTEYFPTAVRLEVELFSGHNANGTLYDSQSRDLTGPDPVVFNFPDLDLGWWTVKAVLYDTDNVAIASAEGSAHLTSSEAYADVQLTLEAKKSGITVTVSPPAS